MMTSRQLITDFDGFLERIIPYDKSQSKDSLYSALRKHPELKELLEKQLFNSEDWAKRATSGEDIYFCVNDSAWKRPGLPPKLGVNLGVIEEHDNKDINRLVVNFNIY